MLAMFELLIVGLIVAAAAAWVLRKYLPKSLRTRLFGKAAAKESGCGAGCDSCAPDCATPGEKVQEKVVTLHRPK